MNETSLHWLSRQGVDDLFIVPKIKKDLNQLNPEDPPPYHRKRFTTYLFWIKVLLSVGALLEKLS